MSKSKSEHRIDFGQVSTSMENSKPHTMKTNLGTIDNSRTVAQRRHMAKTVGRGVCPFCELDEKLNKVVRRGQFWRVWENPFPYPGHRHHIILAHKSHIGLLDCKTDDWTELFVLIRWAILKYKIKGGGVVIRFGSPRLNAGTLTHLHVHIQGPKLGKTAIAVFQKGPGWKKISRALAKESAQPPA